MFFFFFYLTSFIIYLLFIYYLFIYVFIKIIQYSIIILLFFLKHPWDKKMIIHDTDCILKHIIYIYSIKQEPFQD